EVLGNTNPLGRGALPINWNTAARAGGKIVIETQRHGEAWYINPKDNRRYYLGRPADALILLQKLGTTADKSDVNNVPFSYTGADYTVDNFYTLRYPSAWTYKEKSVDKKSYNGLEIKKDVVFATDDASATLEILSLQTTASKTLANFKMASSTNAERTSVKNIIIDVKPCLVQTFKNKTGGYTMYADVMFSTKKFVHMKMSILTDETFATNKALFDQMLKEIKLVY
ncbi:MAG: hypothetical protein V1763_02270, partial [Parcubacteria group bacterium]